MDIFSVLQPGHPRRFAFLSITFGLIANLDIGTEHLRCKSGSLYEVALAIDPAWRSWRCSGELPFVHRQSFQTNCLA